MYLNRIRDLERKKRTPKHPPIHIHTSLFLSLALISKSISRERLTHTHTPQVNDKFLQGGLGRIQANLASRVRKGAMREEQVGGGAFFSFLTCSHLEGPAWR